MFFNGYYTIIGILFILLRTYQGIMVLSIFMSWIPNARSTKIGILVGRASNWYLGYFSNILVFGGIDFTPMIGLILFEYLITML
ncbi:MAG: YggT family protein [Bacilli bacterium]|nr:YggT family protein [Bacilli bacterium]